MAQEEKKFFKRMDWLSFLSLGFFLVLFGTIWIATPNLNEEVNAFFKPENWRLENVTGNIVFPVPKQNYPRLYTAVMQFCLIFGAFHIVILALRFILHEPLNKMGGTLSGIVFWLCAGFLLNMLVNISINWFTFLAGLIISLGLSIIVAGIVRLFKKV